MIQPPMSRTQEAPLSQEAGATGTRMSQHMQGCFSCGSLDHFKRDCSQNRQRSGRNNGNAYYANQRQTAYQEQQQPYRQQPTYAVLDEQSGLINRISGYNVSGKAPVYVKVKSKQQSRLCLLDRGSDATILLLKLAEGNTIDETNQRLSLIHI